MSIEKISDITDKYDYEDTNSDNNSDDSPLVSCGQDGSYNELEYIFNTHLQPYITDKEITKQAALNALDECCAEIKNPRSRDIFYKHLNNKLNIGIQ